MSSAFVHRKTYFFRLISSAASTSICGCMSGSPPAIETIGAPHSSIAASACSTGIRCFSRLAGCWILPQPAHFRLQANSGSSSTSSGNLSLRLSFWRIRYDPTRRLWRSGMLTVAPSLSSVTPLHGGDCSGCRTTCYRLASVVGGRRVAQALPRPSQAGLSGRPLPQLLGEPELHGLGRHDHVLGLYLAEPAQSRHNLPDDGGWCRRSGRDPDGRDAGQPAELNVLRAVNQIRLRAGPFRRL